MKVIMGSMAKGYGLKMPVRKHLEARGHQVIDVGCHDTGTFYKFPSAAERVAKALQDGVADFAINCCGSGTGAIGDMGCHIIDPAFYALDLGAPSLVRAESTELKGDARGENCPRASTVHYTFPARGVRPEVKLTWHDGGRKPPRPPQLEPGRQFPRDGALIVGDKGCMMHGSHGASALRIIPETAMQAYKRPPKTLPRVRGSHVGDWIRACKEGKDGTPASANFEYGGPLTETVLLGVVAIRMNGQELAWDAKNLRITNNEDANALLRSTYREGWSL